MRLYCVLGLCKDQKIWSAISRSTNSLMLHSSAQNIFQVATVVTGVTVDTPDPEVTLMARVTLVMVGYYKMMNVFTD